VNDFILGKGIQRQLARQLGRGDRAAPARVLTGPKWRKIPATFTFGSCAERRERAGGKWKLWRKRVQRAKVAHQAIHDATRWTAAEQIC
jgi:hypothetical protein